MPNKLFRHSKKPAQSNFKKGSIFLTTRLTGRMDMLGINAQQVICITNKNVTIQQKNWITSLTFGLTGNTDMLGMTAQPTGSEL